MRLKEEEPRRQGPGGRPAALPPAAAAAAVAAPPAGGPMMPPGFGTQQQRRRRGGARRAASQGAPPGPSWMGGGPPPPGMGLPGMGRGGPSPGQPLPGSKAEARMRQEARREERRAALFKRQVAAMEVSPTMLGRPAMELRESILRGGPDVAPASSYEELPAAQHCYWADTLLLDQARLQASSVTAPGVDHAAAMAAAMQLHERPPNDDSVLMDAMLGNFAVSKSMADLIAGG